MYCMLMVNDGCRPDKLLFWLWDAMNLNNDGREVKQASQALRVHQSFDCSSLGIIEWNSILGVHSLAFCHSWQFGILWFFGILTFCSMTDMSLGTFHICGHPRAPNQTMIITLGTPQLMAWLNHLSGTAWLRPLCNWCIAAIIAGSWHESQKLPNAK